MQKDLLMPSRHCAVESWILYWNSEIYIKKLFIIKEKQKMKKLLAFILAAMMVLAFVSCGNTENDETSGSTQNTQTSETTNSGTEETEDSTGDETTGTENTTDTPDEPETPETSALDILNTIWNSYADDEKFAIIGGSDMTMNAPGVLDHTDTQTMSNSYYIPEANVSMVDDAASMIHMMNTNTFTGGIYHIADSSNIADFASAVKDSILGAQWICGFPDELLIISVDDYVIVAFGATELIDTFSAKTTAAYDSAEILYNESITG